MTRFDLSRMDDPTYAPGLDRSRGRWKCPRRYVEAGYEPASVRLEADDHAAACRAETRKVLAWWEARTATPDPRTWAHVIWRYRTDAFSPLHDVKENTARGYAELMAYWQDEIGTTHLADTGYEALRMLEKGMLAAGRSRDFAHRRFKMLRILAGYGVAIEAPGAARVRAILSEMRLRKPPARSVAAEGAHVAAVVAEADRRGHHGFALGVLVQWTYALRSVDVRGQWLDGSDGLIVRDGKRWADGLTAEMFSADLSSFTKVLSKTAHSMPEPYTFPVPEALRSRVAAILGNRRFGPLILSRHGLPYSEAAWSRTWRRCADAAGVPGNVWIMDTRSGAITEAARLLEGDAIAARNFAGHSTLATTNRYLRDRSADMARVVELRASGVPIETVRGQGYALKAEAR
jgi:integrase